MEKILKVKYLSDIPNSYIGIVEYPSGTKEWWSKGSPHREDGPAMIYPNGGKEYYYKGYKLDTRKINRLIKKELI